MTVARVPEEQMRLDPRMVGVLLVGRDRRIWAGCSRRTSAGKDDALGHVGRQIQKNTGRSAETMKQAEHAVRGVGRCTDWGSCSRGARPEGRQLCSGCGRAETTHPAAGLRCRSSWRQRLRINIQKHAPERCRIKGDALT